MADGEVTPAQGEGRVSAGGASLKTIMDAGNMIGGFFEKWGVSGTLLIVGTLVAGITIAGRELSKSVWSQTTFITSLAFAFVVLVLGFIAFSDKENREARARDQGVEI